MVDGNDEGINRVVEQNGKYAFFMESSSIQYIIERNCDVTQIGGDLDTKVFNIDYIANRINIKITKSEFHS